MRINSNGYLGIGTNSPIEKVTIGDPGNIAILDTRTMATGLFSSGYKFFDFYGESAAILVEHNGYFGNSVRTLKFIVNGNESLRINSVGNVGIGVSSPGVKLDVNGTIHAKELKVDITFPADYVFDDNYKLLPLEKVMEYVLINKHLPEIPSAKEIKENGLNLGEMQNKLLQKIEELTLYIIEQQKQIEELKKQSNTSHR